MKKSDIIFIVAVIVALSPFFLSGNVYGWYVSFNTAHPYVMAFLKFAVLATLGESIGLRIKNGVYNEKGFGILPRAVVWGVLGVWIAIAMKTFSSGIPGLAASFGLSGVGEAMKGGFSPDKLIGAFMISVMMNTTFGPVFMTLHKITDTHILNNGGSLKALTVPIPFKKIISSLNWEIQWGFVFKKTIPYFWIPAHTITFLLPSNFQVLFAALLGVALGVLLSIAAVSARK